MKHITIVLALAGLLFLLVLLPYGCSKRLPRQVSLAEASKIVNAPFPIPAYLPEGFSITAIYALNHDDQSDTLGITFYPAGTAAGGAADIDNAPIRMFITLHRDGQKGGLKLVGQDYDVAGTRGVLVSADEWNDLIWILPHPESPGEYLMEVKGNKDIPKEELLKMARSVLTRKGEGGEQVKPGTIVSGGMASGLEISASIPELAATSDIVIRGTVVGMKEETRKLPDRENPPGNTRPQFDRYMVIQSFQVRVTEYLKGTGPKAVTVFQSSPVNGIVRNDRPELQEGAEYVLFLFTASRGFWGEGYHVQGPTQGYWRVDGQNVTRPLWSPVTMPIEQLRQEISEGR